MLVNPEIFATAVDASSTSISQSQPGGTGRPKELLHMQSFTEENMLQRDFSFWRTSDFTQICQRSQLGQPVYLEQVGRLDKRFLKEASRNAYRIFRK